MTTNDLAYLLADIGLLKKDTVEHAEDGQQLLRAVCPVHEQADEKTAFVLKTDCWFVNNENTDGHARTPGGWHSPCENIVGLRKVTSTSWSDDVNKNCRTPAGWLVPSVEPSEEARVALA
jgi:hypothetical protein